MVPKESKLVSYMTGWRRAASGISAEVAMQSLYYERVIVVRDRDAYIRGHRDGEKASRAAEDRCPYES